MYFYQYSLLGHDRSFIEPRAWKAALGLDKSSSSELGMASSQRTLF